MEGDIMFAFIPDSLFGVPFKVHSMMPSLNFVWEHYLITKFMIKKNPVIRQEGKQI